MNKDEIIKKCDELLERGIFVPRVDMIKSEDDIVKIKQAGIINTKLLDIVASVIKPGVTLKEIDTLVYNKTREYGAFPAPLNYEGFPSSCCISVGDCVAHGIPGDYKIKSGDAVKVDLTTIYNNYYADSCRSFIFDNADLSLMYERLKRCVNDCVAMIKPWVTTLGDIGAFVYENAKKYGYDVVKELGGHGVGIEFHEEPFIPFCAKKGTDFLIVPGMVFTIEPIWCKGPAKLKRKKNDEFGFYTKDGSSSVQIEYTISINEKGAEIIAF